MKIEKIENKIVSIPYTQSKRWNFGVLKGTTRTIIRIITDERIEGFGECAGDIQIFTTCEEYSKILIGKDPFDIERIVKGLHERGAIFAPRVKFDAISGLEIACWDLIGKKTNQPICKLIGGIFREKFDFLAYVFIDEIPNMIRTAKELANAGVSTLKIKLGKNKEHDKKCVESIREAVGPDIKIILDPNQAWYPKTAIGMIDSLKTYNIEYLEQPTPQWDIDGLSKVREHSSIPIAADESVYTLYELLEVIKKGAADIVLVGVNAAGGVWEAKKFCALAEIADLSVNFRAGPELGICLAAHLHLAASSPAFRYALDTEYNYLIDDIIYPIINKNNFKDVLKKPGLGITVDENKLDKYKELYRKKGDFAESAVPNESLLMPRY